MSTPNPLEHKLTQLKLGRIREVHGQWVSHAEQHELGYAEFLEELLNEELLARQENQIRRKLKIAGFPFAATLEQFEFSLRPELKRAVMIRFFDSSFIEKAGSLIFIGPSGVGKTHLAVALGTKMVQLGYTVRFLTAQRFANQVLAAASRADVDGVLQPLLTCDLLILDDLAYVTKDQAETSVLFELIAARYERRSMLITANQPFGEWDKIFPDQAMTLAAIDRLVHHATILEMNVESYRRREALDRKRGRGRPSAHATIKKTEKAEAD